MLYMSHTYLYVQLNQCWYAIDTVDNKDKSIGNFTLTNDISNEDCTRRIYFHEVHNSLLLVVKCLGSKSQLHSKQIIMRFILNLIKILCEIYSQFSVTHF